MPLVRTKEFNPPPFLYRYRSCDGDYFKSEIQETLNARVYLSKASNLNDPFEVSPTIVESSKSEISRYFRARNPNRLFTRKTMARKMPIFGINVDPVKTKLIKSRHKQIEILVNAGKEVYEAQKKDCSIASFCSYGDHELMWAHYARGHTGYCVEYEVDLMAPSVSKTSFPLQVTYSESRPVLSTLEMVQIGGNSYFDTFGFLRRLYLTKSKRWEYEIEWRIFRNN